MGPLTIVKPLDVVKHIRACFIPGPVTHPVDPLTLEQAEEASVN